MTAAHIVHASTEQISPAPHSNPNVCPGAKRIPIPRLSLLDGVIDAYLHVFPSHLDLDRLRRSIARLCGAIPTLSARYVSSGTEHHLDLCQGSVTLVIAQSDAADPVEEPGLRFQVSQHGGTFDMYLPPIRGQDIRPNVDASLIAFQYTTFTSGVSSLGIGIGHILGDGASHEIIINALSDIYEADAIPNGFEYPQFDLRVQVNQLDSLPPTERIDPSLRAVSVLRAGSPEQVMGQYVAQGHVVAMELVVVTLSPSDISALKKRCEAMLPGSRLSSVDVISGWVGTLLERLSQTKIKALNYVVNLRAVTDIPANFLGNGVSSLMINVEDESADSGLSRLGNIAARVRHSVNRLRSGKRFVQNMLDLTACSFHQVATNGHMFSFAYHPDEMYVNAFTKFDYAATFGFPKSKVRQHQAARALLRAPMITMAMPGDGERGLEVGVMVQVGQGDKARALMEKDRRDWMSGS